jgi:hypothetical protein
MKSILKLLGGLFVGAVVGALILVPFAILFNDMSLGEALKVFFSKDLPTIATIIPALAIAYILQIIIHEGGHLVAGLLTGYRFVSFRFLSFTLIRKDGRLQWRRFDMAGTGGQCLMAPPDKPIDQIDTRWYNAGGVLANIVTALLAIVLICTLDMPKWLDMTLAMMALIGIFMALTNGIPMKLGGVANDGSNLFQLEKDLPTKRCFCTMLEANVRNQEGEPFNEMPDSLFELPQPLDWENSMHVGTIFPVVTRMMELHQWEEAYQLLTEACDNKDDMMVLYQHEVEAVMTLVCIASGRNDEARQHFTKDVAKYVNLHASTQSDKQLDAMAVALALDNDRPAAEKMYHDLQANRDKYIHQSDVALSLDLMQWLLESEELGDRS